jgi:hypothetical protein
MQLLLLDTQHPDQDPYVCPIAPAYCQLQARIASRREIGSRARSNANEISCGGDASVPDGHSRLRPTPTSSSRLRGLSFPAMHAAWI